LSTSRVRLIETPSTKRPSINHTREHPPSAAKIWLPDQHGGQNLAGIGIG
jgi:hypothetical protein